MRFLVYGAGALGQALGAILAAAGHRVDLVLRPRFVDLIRRHGLTVTGIYGDYHVSAEHLGLLTELGGVVGDGYDFILITTKSYDTAAAVTAIGALPGCFCPVVSMQNGCGNVEQLLDRFGEERSFGARIITGFELEPPATVRITVSADAIHVGAARPGHRPAAAARLATALGEAGLPCTAVDDIHQSLYAKLLYNCALNPLGAILGVSYGALSGHRDTRAVMDRVIEETFAVIEALGGTVPWADAAEYRQVFYHTLVPATAGHRSSMLQDLENRKPTEVEAFVGFVSGEGRKKGLATPVCDVLASLIRFREQEHRSR